MKIPKNWEFKYFEVDGNTTKFVYEDQLGIEHIYIDEKPEPELPTYEELEYKYNKQKETLDKIKEYCNNRLQYYNEMRRDYMKEFDGYAENDNENILELLEEIK